MGSAGQGNSLRKAANSARAWNFATTAYDIVGEVNVTVRSALGLPPKRTNNFSRRQVARADSVVEDCLLRAGGPIHVRIGGPSWNQSVGRKPFYDQPPVYFRFRASGHPAVDLSRPLPTAWSAMAVATAVITTP